MVGALHGLHAYSKSGYSLKSTLMMVMLGFVLVLYATFLTRSGILGESSVHSFTDLGLSGQLLAFLFLFFGLMVFLLALRWKEIPGKEKGGEESGTSREFWLFVGSMTLVVSAFQILLTTSIPVFNAVAGTSMAPPADVVSYYNRWQLPIALDGSDACHIEPVKTCLATLRAKHPVDRIPTAMAHLEAKVDMAIPSGLTATHPAFHAALPSLSPCRTALHTAHTRCVAGLVG